MLNKDILGRDLKEGDIVVVKGNGGYEKKQKEMEVGVVINDNIKTMSTLKFGRRPHDIFLVENPTKLELDIKYKILEALDLIKKEKDKRKKDLKLITANIIGGVYVNAKNQKYIYLGNLIIKEYKNNKYISTYEGHLYSFCGHTCEKNLINPEYLKDFKLFTSYNFKVEMKKNQRKFREFLGVVSDFDNISKITCLKPHFITRTFNIKISSTWQEDFYDYIIEEKI